MTDKIPDYSTFSKNRIHRWRESNLFYHVFVKIVQECISKQLADGKDAVTDGSYIPADVSRESWIDAETQIEFSMQSYLEDLDAELAQQPGFKAPPKRIIDTARTTSATDPDRGYINNGKKRGAGYLAEVTVDCKKGIVTGLNVFPANEKESVIVLRHFEKRMSYTGLPIRHVALDRGDDTGAVHRFSSGKREIPTLFETTAATLGIPHMLIRPYTPRHNGKVERSHREDQKRFYDTHAFYSLKDFDTQLAGHQNRRNHIPMRPLHWHTPRESLHNFPQHPVQDV